MQPNRNGPVAQALNTHLQSQRQDRPTACGTNLRGSNAYACTRALALDLINYPPDHQLDLESLLTFDIGQNLHELTQTALQDTYSNVQTEVTVDLQPLGYDMSGHADATYTDQDGKQVCVEIKSQSAYGFSKAVGVNQYGKPSKDGPEGPKLDHLAQACIYALGLDSDVVHIVYLNKAKGDLPAEWTFGMDDPCGLLNGLTPRDFALAELSRLEWVAEQVDDGMLPERSHPEFGVISNPPKHKSEGGKGQPWLCRYCKHNGTCRDLPTEAVPLETLPMFGESKVPA